MIPTTFDYAAPESIQEAVVLLQRQGARVLAGGHDLLTQMKLRQQSPALLVDLRKISGLATIVNDSQGALRIGAMATCSAIAADAKIQAGAQALAEAADSIGDVQVRNLSTIGGNLACGDPKADLAAAVLVLDAVLHVTGPRGSRTVAANQFFVGAQQTALDAAEILTAIEVPATPAGSGSAYAKFKNPANGYPICGVAARVVRGRDGAVVTCRVAVTGAADHPQRLSAVESALEGRVPAAATIAAASAQAAQGIAFTTDLFASGEYRAHLTAVLAERALASAVARSEPS